jgi:hypothetical protein
MPGPDLGSATNAYRLTLSGAGISIDKEVDAAVAAEIVTLALGAAPSTGTPSMRRHPDKAQRQRRASRTKGPDASKRTGRRRSGSPGVVKDLSLRPPGKTPFIDFAAKKQPKTHQQKQAVIAYWLRHDGGLTSGISPDHVNTCYVEAGWPRPADLANNLQVTAGQKGWLDTSEMVNIRITMRGEDEVRHNLPARPKGKDA